MEEGICQKMPVSRYCALWTAMLDPHTGSELDIDSIKAMVDDLIDAHGDYLTKYH